MNFTDAAQTRTQAGTSVVEPRANSTVLVMSSDAASALASLMSSFERLQSEQQDTYERGEYSNLTVARNQWEELYNLRQVLFNY